MSDIGWAMQQLKFGGSVTRPSVSGWVTGVGNSILYNDTGAPPQFWAPSHDDLLALDWENANLDFTP